MLLFRQALDGNAHPRLIKKRKEKKQSHEKGTKASVIKFCLSAA